MALSPLVQRLSLLLLLLLLLLGRAAADKDTCDGCTDYESNDDDDAVDLQSPPSNVATVDATCHPPSSSSIPSSSPFFLEPDTMEELQQLAPDVRRVTTACMGEPEEMCSLLFAVEHFFNASSSSTVAVEFIACTDDGLASESKSTTRATTAPELSFGDRDYYCHVRRAISTLKQTDHVAAHAILQRLKARDDQEAATEAAEAAAAAVEEKSSADGDDVETRVIVNSAASSLPRWVRIAAAATEAITTYLGGDSVGARRRVATSIELAKALHEQLLTASAASAAATAPPSSTTTTSLRRLVATLLFTASKLQVEQGLWSESSKLATEVG